jgi:poly(hydroxyalkanoate) depolymerase family esterase
MGIIDWRELYAANQAVIEGRHAPDTHVPSRHGAPGGGVLLRRPAPSPPDTGDAGDGGSSANGSSAGAAGRVRVAEYHDGRRTRPIRVHVPASLDPATAAPLVVALHGCTQTAATFGAGALLDREADRHGFVVAYPEQVREDNAQGCWNWFSAAHQARGGGEPALIAGVAHAVMAEAPAWTIDRDRVYVVGMSAGAAMASVLAATYPDVFAALAMHSGLAYGCARTLPAATRAMARGGPDPEAQGRAAFAAMGAAARPVPALVIHGSADDIVCPVNGEHAVRQWMATNRLAADGAYDPDLARPDAAVRDDAAGRRASTRRTWTDAAGRVMQEHVEVEGLGHAWSGGAAGCSYTDPRGPSAAAAIWDFFARVSA